MSKSLRAIIIAVALAAFAYFGLPHLGETMHAPESAGGDYDRAAFGPAWADVDGNGCDTRNDILARDLDDITLDADGCTVLSGTLTTDPYTGERIDFTRGAQTSMAVQIEHVVALEDAWVSGADGWTDEERKQFANDPANLIAVDGPTNGAKGSKSADEWLPPNEAYHCQYAQTQIAVKDDYGLSFTDAERAALDEALSTC